MTGPFDIGDGLVATATFEVAGVRTDPTTLTAKVRHPDGTVTTDTYSAEAGQPDPHIVRTEVGVFTLTLVPDAAGVWAVVWTATGAVTAVVSQTYTVSPSPISGALLASYTGDPANRPVDELRLYLGDTQEPFLLSDAEVGFFLSSAGDVALTAAVAAAKALAIRFSRLVDSSVGDIQKSYSQQYKHFAEMAKRLADDAKEAAATEVAPIPWAGGLTHSEREANGADGDLIPPYFYEGMDSRPGTVDTRARW